MSCDELDLDAWGLGLTDRGERRDVEDHLSWCADCAARAEGLRGILDALSSRPARADSAALEARILASAFRRPRRSLAWIPAAAALLLVLYAPLLPEKAAPIGLAPPATVRPEPIAHVPEIRVAPEPEVDVDVPPPPAPAPAEAVAYSWEEASARPAPWEDVELERPEDAVRAGPLFAGWARDEELGGAALIGLSLGF
jgi:hypothetical protein